MKYDKYCWNPIGGSNYEIIRVFNFSSAISLGYGWNYDIAS